MYAVWLCILELASSHGRLLSFQNLCVQYGVGILKSLCSSFLFAYANMSVCLLLLDNKRTT